MRKIIIHIDDSVTDELALKLALRVVKNGKISQSKGVEQYCLCTTFLDGSHVSADKRPTGTDVFRIWSNECLTK